MNAIVQRQRRVAIIGSGIAGLGAAHRLADSCRVTLFEAEPELGGHSRTRDVAGVAVDTGFIVFNYKTYPLLTALFAELEVETHSSSMTFGASLGEGRFEYAFPALRGVYAQPRNLLSPRYFKLIQDIRTFNRRALASLEEGMTLRDLLAKLKLGDWFQRRYLLAMVGAIWSTAPADMLDYPAATLLRFMDNHGLLSIWEQPEWRTVTGGSRAYVRRLEASLRARGVTIHCNAEVSAVQRDPKPTIARKGASAAEPFDAVIFACHADQALELLSDADARERQILAALRYAPNEAILHSDPRAMPKRRAAWASWNYLGDFEQNERQVSVTYWMNQLQSLPESPALFVTLNPRHDMALKAVHDRVTFWHPQYDAAALAAQRQLPSIQGLRQSWFCGAYARHGFHEDGLWSGYQAADHLLAQIAEGRSAAAAAERPASAP